MISLDFQLADRPIAYEDKDPETILHQIGEDTFQGGQKFIVNGRTFVTCQSMFPVLWFAHELRHVLQWLDTKEKGYWISLPDGGETFVFLKAEDHQVKIGLYPQRDQVEVVQGAELARVISSYYKRVYKKCTALCPRIKTSEILSSWLFDEYDNSKHGLNRR